MSRALVLGGGGPVGIGWEAGLVVGLAGSGVDLAGADAIVGTSAGSVVGAQLALGADLSDATSQIAEASSWQPAVDSGGMEQLLAAVAASLDHPGPPEQARIELGRLSLGSVTMPEERFVDVFSVLAGRGWPPSFSCTAIDTATGELAVWDAASGVDLQRAVASSCAVPGIYPPVSINGTRYMDGGMRTALNADLVQGHDVAVVVSVTALSLPEGMSDPILDKMLAQVGDELAALRSSGTQVAVIEPSEEFLDLSGWGLKLMDFGLVAAAFDAGGRQGEEEAPRLVDAWLI